MMANAGQHTAAAIRFLSPWHEIWLENERPHRVLLNCSKLFLALYRVICHMYGLDRIPRPAVYVCRDGHHQNDCQNDRLSPATTKMCTMGAGAEDCQIHSPLAELCRARRCRRSRQRAVRVLPVGGGPPSPVQTLPLCRAQARKRLRLEARRENLSSSQSLSEARPVPSRPRANEGLRYGWVAPWFRMDAAGSLEARDCSTGANMSDHVASLAISSLCGPLSEEALQAPPDDSNYWMFMQWQAH